MGGRPRPAAPRSSSLSVEGGTLRSGGVHNKKFFEVEKRKEKIVYWITGSQTLYGDDVLAHVAQHSQEMADYVNAHVPVTVKYLTTCKSSDEIEAAVKKVNEDENCIGIITWCHTFSPAKMWIRGFTKLQ